MFSLSKLIWLGVILFAVWNFFRLVEKRQALKERIDANNEKPANKQDSDNDTLDAIYCSRCATFAADERCECADSGIFD